LLFYSLQGRLIPFASSSASLPDLELDDLMDFEYFSSKTCEMQEKNTNSPKHQTITKLRDYHM
jgi:hypothetical protein